jgi:hypothetical protein
LPLVDALSVIYVLSREWLANVDMLKALGVKNPDRIDDIFQAPPARSAKSTVNNAAAVVAMGGEVG